MKDLSSSGARYTRQRVPGLAMVLFIVSAVGALDFEHNLWNLRHDRPHSQERGPTLHTKLPAQYGSKTT